MLAHDPMAQEPGVSVEIADLFTWSTEKVFDSVVFTFWISHIPYERLESFFIRLSSQIRSNGQIFFVDGKRQVSDGPHIVSFSGQTATRKLYDGRIAEIVKNYFTTEQFHAVAQKSGIELSVYETPTFFQYGIGKKST